MIKNQVGSKIASFACKPKYETNSKCFNPMLDKYCSYISSLDWTQSTYFPLKLQKYRMSLKMVRIKVFQIMAIK